MKCTTIFQRVLCAVGLAFTTATGAQEIDWRARLSADIPAGIAFKAMTPSPFDPASSISVSLVTYGTYSERSRYRVLTMDSSEGSARWSHDFGSVCEYVDTSQGLIEVLSGGDIVVAIHGHSTSRHLYTCLARLRASDGAVVWSRIEQNPNVNTTIHAAARDATGGILLTGRKGNVARVLRLDASSGASLWERDLVDPNGAPLRGIAIASNATGDIALELLSIAADGATSLLLEGLSVADGTTRWSVSRCPGAVYSVDAQSEQLRVRHLTDGTFVHGALCRTSGTISTHLERMNAKTGASTWRVELPQTSGPIVIDEEGGTVLAGNLTLGGTPASTARFSKDGILLWSKPAQSGAVYRIASRGAEVSILELQTDISNYVTSTAVSTYAAGDGSVLAHVAVPLPTSEAMLLDRIRFGVLGDGDAIVAGLSGLSRSVGLRLYSIRLRHGVTEPVWQSWQPVMASFPFMAQEEYASGPQFVLVNRGEPGVVVAGQAPDGNGHAYPRVTKISRHDGRQLWRWEPDGRVNGAINALLRDANEDVVIAGDNGWESPSLLLEKLDGTNGEIVWKYRDGASPGALHAALDPAGNVVLVLNEGGVGNMTTHVAKHSSVNGNRLWDVEIADGNTHDRGDHRVAVLVDGSALVVGRFVDAQSRAGLHILKFRGIDGALQWRRSLPGIDAASNMQVHVLALPGGDALVSNYEHVWRVEGSQGEVAWQADFPLSTWAHVIDEQGHLIVSGQLAGQRAVARLSASSGGVMWLRSFPPAGATQADETISALASAVDGNLLVAGGDGAFTQSVAALSVLDGAVQWQVDANLVGPGALRQPAGSTYFPVAVAQASDGNVFFGGNARPFAETWTVLKATGAFADGIYANGFE